MIQLIQASVNNPDYYDHGKYKRYRYSVEYINDIKYGLYEFEGMSVFPDEFLFRSTKKLYSVGKYFT